jgi:hypothetical protein
MGKRRADSDDEISANGSPASKRARTVDSDDERAPPASARRASKGKARRRDDDDDDESGSEDAPDYDEEAERKFEEEYEDSIRTALENRRKFQGVSVSLNTH